MHCTRTHLFNRRRIAKLNIPVKPKSVSLKDSIAWSHSLMAHHINDPKGVASSSPAVARVREGYPGSRIPFNPSISRVARRAKRVYWWNRLNLGFPQKKKKLAGKVPH